MVRLEIKKTGINGEGIAFYRRKPVFIEGCLKDEIVECEPEDQGSFYRAKLKKILKKSPHRIRSECPFEHLCGACALMCVDYEEQLNIKKELLEGALYKYAGYSRKIEGTISSPEVLHYRNKCNLPVFEHDGRLVNALYRPGTNHPVLIDDCLIHDEGVEKIRKQILRVMNDHHLQAYRHKEKSGIRQLIVRGINEEYQAVIITGKDNIPEEVIDDLKKIEGLCSIFQGINTKKNPVNMMPEKLKKLYGKDRIAMKIGGYELFLSPQAFFQLNHLQAERIYQDVSNLVPENCGKAVEAYCGIGAISLFLGNKAKEVWGIELEEKAVNDAKENAKHNGFGNLHFICDDAPEALRKITKKEKIDVLVVDPPRTGLDERLLETLLKTRIGTVIYISCNPATLGKDLAVLMKKYSVELVRAYDMFPQTAHVESVALLKRSRS